MANMRISSIAVNPSHENLGEIEARIIFATPDQSEQVTTPNFGLQDARQLLSMLNDVVRDAEDNEAQLLIGHANKNLSGVELDLLRNTHVIVCAMLIERGEPIDTDEAMENRGSLSANDFMQALMAATSIATNISTGGYGEHIEAMFPVSAKISKLSTDSLHKVRAKLENSNRLAEEL